MTTQTKSLYDRLGGLDAIEALTESWVARVEGDDRASGRFVRADIPRLKKEVIDQLRKATGGPCAYTGRSMRDTPAGMKTTTGEFDVLMQHLGRRSTSSMSLRRSRTSWSACSGRFARTSSRRRRFR